MDSVVVKRTFIEVADNDSEPRGFEGMRFRSSSDSAVYDTFERKCSVASSLAGDDYDYEIQMTGISDTDTNPISECEAGAQNRLPCYQYIAQDLPLPVSNASETVEAEKASSKSLDHSEESAVNQLMSENARLALENKLLKENARLAAENASLKANSAALQQDAPAEQPQPQPQCTDAAAGQCYMGAPVSWGYAQQGFTGFQMPVQTAFFAVPWGGDDMMEAYNNELAYGQRRGRRQRGVRGAAKLGETYLTGDDEMMTEERTTVMLRNLPNNYTRAMVLAMLDKEGFRGKYDFLYLPIDFKTRACLGYAFVNLVSPSVVPTFWKAFEGYSRWALPSKKICGVTWSGPHQGLEAHVERYRNSPVMHATVPEEYQPVVFEAGRRVPFPAPSKMPRAPRARNCAEGNRSGSSSNLPRRAA